MSTSLKAHIKAHKFNMGIIGNCTYMAHIDDRAHVRWMCWPQFDSDFVFGSLVDHEKGGTFSVEPAEENYKSRQFYFRNTNILCTEFETSTGKFQVIDFAPRFIQFERSYRPTMLMRKIELLSGSPRIRIVCEPRRQYGQNGFKTELRSNHIRYDGRESEIRLYSDFPLTQIQSRQEVILSENFHLILSWGLRIEEDIATITQDYLNKTQAYWQKWVQDAYIPNFQQKMVIRSCLALKIHQFEDTGAIIAAGTTSLPEHPGSGRNWDYRYCWIRDSYYTLAALNSMSSFYELKEYATFIQNIVPSAGGRYQPLYSITGQAKLIENEMPLGGYLGNQPVRIGNQAYEHIQNDAYGQLLISFLPLYVDARLPRRYGHAPSPELVRKLLQKIDDLMDEPDAGLWEFRNLAQHHSYTYLFHWAGAQAARKIGRFYQDEPLVQLANKVISRSQAWLEKCFDRKRGVYTQAAQTSNLDASLLQLITMNYLDPRSEVAKTHLEALEKELRTEQGLFYRYLHKDDFGKPKSTFLVCSFWYVEALACVGRIDDAIRVFEQLVSYGNHVALFSEDVDERDGSQWGNFPQAYSHVGLLNAAFRIARKIDQPLFLG